MKIVVLGLGVSGQAVVKYLQKQGDEVIGVDRKAEEIRGISIISDQRKPELSQTNLLVKSPGISHGHPWVQEALRLHIPVVGEIDLAFAALKGKNKRILGITGSNGKTTTTLMCAHLINQSNKNALAVGNVGLPLIAQIERECDVFVVELSSFQLQHIQHHQVLDGAAILNITPNHLDHHSNFKEYMEAKLQILSCLKESGSLYVSQQVLEKCGGIDRSYQILDPMKEKVATILSLGYRDGSYCLFPHDMENIAAASALADTPLESLAAGLKTFVKPPHRLEWIKTVQGVTYINDSKATSIDAVIKAIEAIPPPIFLIAGGIDKGGSYQDWISHFKDKVLKVFALGEAAQKIESALFSHVDVEIVSSLFEGVTKASQRASGNMTILLSPGCASYDQFRDYQHRGETFRKIVEDLH